MNTYLIEQLRLHPLMQPQDVLKMCWQAAMGAEHIITNPQSALAYLETEFDAVHPREMPLFERISPEFCRVNMQEWKRRGFKAQALGQLFLASSEPDSSACFDALLDEYTATIKAVWNAEQLRQYEEYLEQYTPGAVHHSETYRRAYDPHYRLVRTKLLDIR